MYQRHRNLPAHRCGKGHVTIIERLVMLVRRDKGGDLGPPQRNQRAATKDEGHRDRPGATQTAHERAVVRYVGALHVIAHQEAAHSREHTHPRRHLIALCHSSLPLHTIHECGEDRSRNRTSGPRMSVVLPLPYAGCFEACAATDAFSAFSA